MTRIGEIPMPDGFRYRDIFLKGKPKHDKMDPFSSRHPAMDRAKRAKIFAPFDALRGFSDAVASKDVLYVERSVSSGEEAEELSRRFKVLHDLTLTRRAAEENRVQVEVTYFEVCSDVSNEAFGLKGLYRTVKGLCLNVDAEVTGTILIAVGSCGPDFHDSESCAAKSCDHESCGSGFHDQEAGAQVRISIADVRKIEFSEDLPESF